jgi:hypothetical protein
MSDRRAQKARRRAKRIAARPLRVAYVPPPSAWDRLTEQAANGEWCLICGGPTCSGDTEEHCDSCGWVCNLSYDCACAHCALAVSRA